MRKKYRHYRSWEFYRALLCCYTLLLSIRLAAALSACGRPTKLLSNLLSGSKDHTIRDTQDTRYSRFIGAVGDPDNTRIVVNPNTLYRVSALSLYLMLKIEFAVLFRTLCKWAGRLNPWNLNLKITRFHIIGLKSEM
jgi:hypothetical protein